MVFFKKKEENEDEINTSFLPAVHAPKGSEQPKFPWVQEIFFFNASLEISSEQLRLGDLVPQRANCKRTA